MGSLLDTQHLTKDFGKFRAVNDVTLTFEERESTAILGPNGAGKTTLLNLLSGKLSPTSGSVRFRGEEITGFLPFRITEKGISRSFQITNIFPNLTAFENIRAAVIAKKKKSMNFFSNSDRFEEIRDETLKILNEVMIPKTKHAIPSSALSHGDQRYIELGIALANDPYVLLLDEPTAGMSSGELSNFIALLMDVHTKGGKTIIFIAHDLDVVFSIAKRIIVMHQGAVIADGDPEVVRRDKNVKEVYLGDESE